MTNCSYPPHYNCLIIINVVEYAAICPYSAIIPNMYVSNNRRVGSDENIVANIWCAIAFWFFQGIGSNGDILQYCDILSQYCSVAYVYAMEPMWQYGDGFKPRQQADRGAIMI